MSEIRCAPHAALAAALALAPALAAAGPNEPAAERPAFPVNMSHDPNTAGLVRELLGNVHERLGDARCAAVFSDFQDGEGRPLSERLRRLARGPTDYLGLVVFHDGRRHPRCGRRGTLAVTSPGSRLVHVCPDALREARHRTPKLAEAILIHEVLHTLGLGEDPPSSTDITARILKRCYR
jgi:hypothetical protein